MKRLAIAAVGLALVVGAAAVVPAPSIAAAQITEIIDGTGDGAGNTLSGPYGIAVDGNGNVYVTGYDNAFRITPGGVITEIIDSTGDGAGNTLDVPYGIAVDVNGNVYVAGFGSSNAFKITAPLAVGGVAELPPLDRTSADESRLTGEGSGWSVGYSTELAVGLAAVAVATAAAAWYARRRWLR